MSPVAQPTRRAALAALGMAIFAPGAGKAAVPPLEPAIPAELKASFWNFGEPTQAVVLPPGRPVPPLPEGAWRTRLPLGDGWQVLLVNLEEVG